MAAPLAGGEGNGAHWYRIAARPLPEEVDYLVRTFRRHFPHRDLFVRDRFAGLRVLPAGHGSAFRRTRETLYLTDDPARPRLVSVVGGKLTGYRAAAAQVAARLAPALPARAPRADTATLRLPDK